MLPIETKIEVNKVVMGTVMEHDEDGRMVYTMKGFPDNITNVFEL